MGNIIRKIVAIKKYNIPAWYSNDIVFFSAAEFQ
jgi:hypothetical protein